MRYKSYGMPRILLTVFALVVALAAVAPLGRFAWAQGGETLSYGSNIVGSTTAEIPYAIYAINMNEGDTISLLVAGLTPDMLPSVSMVGPTENPLAVSEADPFSPAGSHRTRIDYRADQTGGYTIIVTNLNGSPGQFLLMLDGQPASVSTPLTLDTPALATIDSGAAVYTFQLSAAGNLVTLSTQTPGFSFLARVYDGLGRLVAGLAGTDLRGVALDIGPGVGQYVVEVSALTSGTQGSVRIDLVAGSGGQTGAVLPGGGVIVATATPSVCQVIGANRVNIRSGPSTAYPAIGSLFPGSSLNVVGSNNGLTWYVVDYNGQQGWVSGSVTELGRPVWNFAHHPRTAAAAHGHAATDAAANCDPDVFCAIRQLYLDGGRGCDVPAGNLLYLLLECDQRPGDLLRWAGSDWPGAAASLPDRVTKLCAAHRICQRHGPRPLDPRYHRALVPDTRSNDPKQARPFIWRASSS